MSVSHFVDMGLEVITADDSGAWAAYVGLAALALGAVGLAGRARIYRNLARKDDVVYSVLGPDGRVRDHAKNVVVSDAGFVVRQGGRARVLREKRKNVHAFVTGNVRHKKMRVRGRWVKIVYNPYKFRTFVKASGHKPVHKADYVSMDRAGVWAINPR